MVTRLMITPHEGEDNTPVHIGFPSSFPQLPEWQVMCSRLTSSLDGLGFSVSVIDEIPAESLCHAVATLLHGCVVSAPLALSRVMEFAVSKDRDDYDGECFPDTVEMMGIVTHDASVPPAYRLVTCDICPGLDKSEMTQMVSAVSNDLADVRVNVITQPSCFSFEEADTRLDTLLRQRGWTDAADAIKHHVHTPSI